MTKYKRGDMFYADLSPGIGSEQLGRRPVLIVQNNTLNKSSTTVIVAAITSRAEVKGKLSTHCYLNAGHGLGLPSVVMLEQLRTMDKKRLGNYIGRLSDSQMHDVERALGVVLACPKRN